MTLAAPPAAVWSLLSEPGGWSSWNPLLTGYDGPLAVGRIGVLHVSDPRWWVPRRLRVKVDVVIPERNLSWTGPPSLARLALAGCHSFRIRPDEKGGTRFVHVERFTGTLMPLVWPRLRPVVEEGHRKMNAALVDKCRAQA